MARIIVTSPLDGDGKSVVAAGIAQALRAAGGTVRLIRVGADARAAADARAFALAPGVRADAAPGAATGLLTDTDHLVIEAGTPADVAALRTTDSLVLLVTRAGEADDASLQRVAGEVSPAGLIVNAAGGTAASAEAARLAGLAGAPLWGILPQDRLLAAPSIRAMAAAVEGSLEGDADLFDEATEWLQVGPISAHGGIDYFQRLADKTVITRSDKIDVALAALDHEPACLILSRGEPRLPYVRQRAESEPFALIITALATPEAVNRIGALYAHAPFQGARKVARAGALVQAHLDVVGSLSAALTA